MRLEDLPSRARLVLEILTTARMQEPYRPTGPWVHTQEFLDKVRLNFKVGIHALHKKKRSDPDPDHKQDLGFTIVREALGGETTDWRYKLVGHPFCWGDDCKVAHAVMDRTNWEKGQRLMFPRPVDTQSQPLIKF